MSTKRKCSDDASAKNSVNEKDDNLSCSSKHGKIKFGRLVQKVKNATKKRHSSLQKKRLRFENFETSDTSFLPKQLNECHKMVKCEGEKSEMSSYSSSIALRQFQRLTLRGCFSLKVASGVAEINGFLAKPDNFFNILCPFKGGMQVNICSKNKETCNLEIDVVKDFKLSFLMNELKTYHEYRRLFFDDTNDQSSTTVPFSSDSDVFCEISEQVYSIANSICEQRAPFGFDRQIVCVCGTKNSGKSTSCLFLSNLLLNDDKFTQVLWLDCDVGQPEFTVPGCVSVVKLTEPVFGPSFCHLKKPLISFFVGCVNIADCVSAYMKAVEKAIEYIRANFDKNVPVVVNMPGWVEVGLGFEITANIIRIVQPSILLQLLVDKTNVIELDSKTVNENSNLTMQTTAAKCCRELEECNYNLFLVHLWRPHKSPGSVNASNERQLRILSHFHSYVDHESSQFDNVVAPSLFDFPRKTLSFCGKVLEVFPMSASLNPKLILMALNMTVVSFCKLETNCDFVDQVSINDGDFFVASEQCQKINTRIIIGQGVVTEINKENCTMSVITELSEDDLQHCQIISKGSLPVPQSALLKRDSSLWRQNKVVSNASLVAGCDGGEKNRSGCLPSYVTNLHPRVISGTGMAPKRTYETSTNREQTNGWR